MSSDPEVRRIAQLSFGALGHSARNKAVQENEGKENNLAPMLRHYLEVKAQYKEHLLLYQVGDFYEVFFDDARVVADVLSIRLTTRDKNCPDPVPLCGVPIHAIDNYLPKLLEQGFSCVIMSQVEEAQKGNRMVRREISRIVTPGVRYAGDGLEEKEFNYLAAVLLAERGRGAFSFIDVSAGLLRLQDFETLPELLDLLERVHPAELILPLSVDGRSLTSGGDWLKTVRKWAKSSGAHLVWRPFSPISQQALSKRVTKQLNDTFSSEGAYVLGAVLSYVDEVSFGRPPTIAQLQIEHCPQAVVIDAATRKNLELFASSYSGERKNSLIEHIDLTKTAMGARLIRDWLASPSSDLQEINARLEAVAELVGRQETEKQLRTPLAEIRDVERILSRVSTGRATPKDVRQLADSLAILPGIADLLRDLESPRFVALRERFDTLQDLQTTIDRALEEDPPLKMTEGGIFRRGYNESIDNLRHLASDGKRLIAELETRERESSGISGLKIKYNSIFGYYIEISKAQMSKAPAHFERKQTLVNAERYSSAELKELELSLLSARARQIELEKSLFLELRSLVNAEAARVQAVAQVLSELDVLAALAEVALKRNYCRPELTNESILEIHNGRHPVVENVIGAHNFVPNDTFLNSSDRRFAVLTGPNMGGKSTYLRQVGIIQILAQIGSFVPAQTARIGLVDRIFTRIGASDDISHGQSTFMVEMQEASSIVRRASSSSLVLIDEIGRGTATSDGLALATSIAEWLLERNHCRTVFATHFHELTELPASLAGSFCISVGVLEQENELIFTHRIEEGPSLRSYGIEVAKLAGLPDKLVTRAAQLLNHQADNEKKINRIEVSSVPELAQAYDENTLKLRDGIRSLNPNSMTPFEALGKIIELKKLAGDC